MYKNYDRIADDIDSDDEYSPPMVYIEDSRRYVRTDPSPTDSQIFSPAARRKRREDFGTIDEFSDDETDFPSASKPASSSSTSSATAQNENDDNGVILEKKDDKDRSCEEWMRRSKYWEGMPGVWDPIRCVGKGTYGIVGLFEYAGEDKSAFPRYIVVKQSGSALGYLQALNKESDMLQQLGQPEAGEPGGKHIVRLYKSFHRAPGTGTHPARDPSPWTPPDYDLDDPTYDADKEVGRIFLEFASNGDLLAYIKNKHIIDQPSEEEVWRLFHCLAEGALALARENEGNEAGKHRPIVHLDMKPNNILIGERNKDLSHRDPGIFKFTDFGISEWVPEESSDAWLKHAEWRATPGWEAPEQVIYNMKDRILGLQLNIWGVGTVVNSYFTAGHDIEEGRILLAVERKTDRPEKPEEKFYTHEPDICISPYSDYFKYALFRTLAYGPTYRWTARQLVKITSKVVDQFNLGTVKGDNHLIFESGTILAFHIERYNEDWKELNFEMATPPPVSGDYSSAISQAVGDFDVLELPSGQSQPLSRRASWETLLPSNDEGSSAKYEIPSLYEEYV